ncbi:Protein transport protein sec16 [Mycena kentingensis (nom. inval.)]|nr:Protein transport protein sec16 [Mycena kentingensis (nom. inval.)]
MDQESAASLFGADSAPDLFATLGTDDAASSDDWLSPSPPAPTQPSAPPPPVQDAPLEAPTQPSKPYSPYAPQTSSYAPTTNTYAPPAPNPYAPPATPAQSAYNPTPYAPPAAAPSTAYSTQYKSPYATYAQTPATPYAAQQVPVVPPPPAPAPSLNRPKISNAYDPPFPTSRPNHRAASGARNSAYAQYATPLQPPPPVPPLPSGPQFTASGYALPPPPPERSGSLPQSSAWGAPPPLPPSAPPVSAYTSPPPPRPPSVAQRKDSAASENGLSEPPNRTASPAKSVAPPPRAASRADSVTSQKSSSGYRVPPLPDGLPRTSSPASYSSQSPEAGISGSSAFTASPPSGLPERITSPASLHSLDRARSPPTNPYLPNGNIHRERAPSPLKQSSVVSPYDPPVPSFSPPTNGRDYNPESSAANGLYNPPPKPSYSIPPPLARNRSESSSSAYGSDGYAPKNGHLNPQRSETDYGAGAYTSRYNYGLNETSAYDTSQEVLVKPTLNAGTYAPSPSLLGANDPLARTSSRAPVFSFGFGGKFLTCFHGASINTGFDVALASKNSTGIQIRQLTKIIPSSALETSSAVFPGPLFSDPGSPTIGLVRATASNQTKTKKTKLAKYLADRASEISQAIGYLNSGSFEGQQLEGKLILVKLLKVLVENDGKLSGTPQIDAAVRAALVPRLESDSAGPTEAANGFSTMADLQGGLSLYPTADEGENPLSTTVLRPAALEKIQEFLVRGERRKAYHFALDEKLWAHAMVIASSIDRDAWKETVNEFLRTELGANSTSDAKAGREGLRVAYSLYSGQGSASVQELVPQNLLSRATARLQVPSAPHKTPLTPNFAAPAAANNIPVGTLASWAETVAMMFSSPMTADTSAALTALGDQLLAHQWVEAAHVCYLLSPQTAPLGGLGNPTARIVLLGSRSPQVWPSFYKDSDPAIFTEILEFALSLTPPAKGQDAFFGFPHLQAYRFIRAIGLAELGELQLASRYCEAISVSFSRASPYFTPVLLEQLKALSDRIVGVDHHDKSGFWKSTPSLDTIGRFLEGRFTKLVTGDADPNTPIEEQMKMNDAASGPFSQYSTISTISSAAPSTNPSPQPSIYNLSAQAHLPPPRSGSATGYGKSHATIDRASSAMDHVRRRQSPAPPPQPRIASANASTTTFAQAPSYVSAYGNYSPNPYSPNMNMPTARPNQDNKTTKEEPEDDAEGAQEVSWWGASAYGNTDSANQTPMATTFHQVDGGVTTNADGFISLMDDSSYSVSSAPTSNRHTPQASTAEEDDEDDLGFGNSKKPPKKEAAESDKAGSPASAAASTAAPTRPDPNPVQSASSGSWFGRWWGGKKQDGASGPVKANLGEETSFYYDKELKKWVNKSAGAEIAKPAAPPPPPSRPQSAAPGPRTSTMTPPPRAASAAFDSAGGPPKPPIRRSNLAPPDHSGTPPPSSPTSSSAPSPPPGPPSRPKSQTGKRAIRSRYVDVFKEPGA